MDKEFKMVGVGKFDLLKELEVNFKFFEEGGDIEGVFLYGFGRFGGEVIFVFCNFGRDGLEDDGYLIVFVYDEIKEYDINYF